MRCVARYLAERGRVEPDTAWRAIVLASIANMVFKAGVVWSLGGLRLALRVAAWFGVLVAVGVGLMVFW